MADVPEPENPEAASGRARVNRLRIWGSSLLVASLGLFFLGRRSQALAFGMVGALLAAGSFIRAASGREKRSLLSGMGLAGAGFLTLAVVLGSILAFGFYRPRQKAENDAETKAKAPAARVDAATQAPIDAGPYRERRCRIVTHGDSGGSRFVNVELEHDAGVVEVSRSTLCVVLDEGPTHVRVRITDGRRVGTIGWVTRDHVAPMGP